MKNPENPFSSTFICGKSRQERENRKLLPYPDFGKSIDFAFDLCYAVNVSLVIEGGTA